MILLCLIYFILSFFSGGGGGGGGGGGWLIMFHDSSTSHIWKPFILQEKRELLKYLGYNWRDTLYPKKYGHISFTSWWLCGFSIQDNQCSLNSAFHSVLKGGCNFLRSYHSYLYNRLGHERFKWPQIAEFMGLTWANLGPLGPRWAPCWPHEPCYQRYILSPSCSPMIIQSGDILW